MTAVKTDIAEAAAPVLEMFHALGERPLSAVRQICTEGSLDEIIFDFGSVSMVVAADEEDDSIDIAISEGNRPKGVDASRQEPWSELIGKPFGWGWLTINQQGYCDGILLSFGDIRPQVLLNVMASSIKVAAISL
jgi:Family of unknown function (DUF6334)